MPGVPRQPSIEDISSSSDSGKENASPTPLVQVAGKSIPTNNQQYPDAEDPYSIDGVPKLERFIEMDHLPEVLVVFDRSNVTNRGTKRAGQPLRYKRVFPEVPARTREPREGQLHLDSSNLVAEGRRSCVHRAPLVATLHPTDASPTRVAVVAKTATSCCRSHHLLREEAKGYAAFPREFFEDSELIPADAPLKAHRPAMRPRGFPGWGVAMNPKSKPKNLAPPIVPNFYGLYVPMNSKGKVLARTHEECKDFANSDCYVPHWPRSILLMQDCGEPVEQPEGMSLAHRFVPESESLYRACVIHRCSRLCDLSQRALLRARPAHASPRLLAWLPDPGQHARASGPAHCAS